MDLPEPENFIGGGELSKILDDVPLIPLVDAVLKLDGLEFYHPTLRKRMTFHAADCLQKGGDSIEACLQHVAAENSALPSDIRGAIDVGALSVDQAAAIRAYTGGLLCYVVRECMTTRDNPNWTKGMHYVALLISGLRSLPDAYHVRDVEAFRGEGGINASLKSALSTDQVYRDGMPYREILRILMDAAGTRFDGNIVCTLARWIENEGVPFTEGNADFGAIAPSSAPVQPEETLEANSLCQVFSYLYMLESLYDAFYLVDSDMRLIIWNRGAEKLLKRSAWDMLGKVWSSRLIPYADRSDQPLADEAYPMKRVAANERATIENLHLLNPEGPSTEVELQTVPLLGETGGLQGVAEIFRDSSRPSRRPQEYRDLKLAASRDPLTNLSNRGELETQLALMVSDFASQSDPEPFSVMFLDVDFFKSINDTHGHTVGDAVLVDVARHLQQETYSGELVARYGGEEFVVLCPETRMDDVIKRAERIRSSLGRTPMGNESHLKVTASFGVTEIEPGDSVESVLSRADMALYQAKEDGRDRTRSLTHADQLLGKEQPEAEPAEVDPFVYSAAFTACIGADMIAYKLGGFVNDLDATLVEVAPKRAVIRLGKKSLFPMWGMTDDRRPVELEIEFGDERTSPIPSRRSTIPQVAIHASIRPLGWIRKSDIFQKRARRVMKFLREYFAAQSQDTL